MILLLAVAAGLLAGLARAGIQKKTYQVPELSWIWLVILAVTPQLLAFHITATAGWFSDRWAAAILVLSQLALLAFVWVNRQLTGVKIFGLGLVLNLLVISLNGGLMPMSPETAGALFPELPTSTWMTGFRPGRSKNIILPISDTRLSFLSDALLLPAWFPWTRALSPGDLLIALGIFWLLAVEAPHDPDSDQHKRKKRT
ncbi:MAG: DUF5317 domain-containing protein [Anaerolineales bacterium]